MKTIRVVFGILALTACAHAAVVVNPATSAVAYTNGPNGTKYIYNLDYSGNETLAGTMTAPQIVDLSLNNGQCVTVNGLGQLASAGFACGIGSGGVYPATATASFPLGETVSTATFSGIVTMNTLSPNQCVQTNSSGQLVSAAAACNVGGGGGTSTLATIAAGVIISSPTAVLNFDTNTITLAFAAASTATVKLNPNNTLTSLTLSTITLNSQEILGTNAGIGYGVASPGFQLDLECGGSSAIDCANISHSAGTAINATDTSNNPTISASNNTSGASAVAIKASQIGGNSSAIEASVDVSTGLYAHATSGTGILAKSSTGNAIEIDAGAFLDRSVVQSTFTGGLAVGSATVTGTGAGQIGLTEGTSTSLTIVGSAVDVLYADNGTHLLSEVANNTSTGTIAISTTPITPGFCAAWTATGELNSISCSASGPTLAGNNIWTGQNSWTTVAPSSFSFGVVASSMVLQTNAAQRGGELDLWNSGNNNKQIVFLQDNGASLGFIYLLSGGEMQMDNHTGGPTQFLTNGSNRMEIANGGNIGINESGPADTQLGILGSSANSYSLKISTSASSFQLAVSTAGHFISSGTVPSVSSCGTSPSIIGNDHAGVITTGSGSPTTCAITFAATYGIGCNVACIISDSLTSITPDVVTGVTSSTFTFSAALNSGTINYICEGVGGQCR